MCGKFFIVERSLMSAYTVGSQHGQSAHASEAEFDNNWGRRGGLFADPA